MDLDVDAFRRDGAIAVRGLLTVEEVATLERGVERNLADLSPLAINATEPGRPGAFIEDFCRWQEIPEYEAVIRASRIGEVSAALMGARQVRLFHDHLLVKEAGTADRTPWHQDQPYYSIDGEQTVSFWIPLDPVARANTLEFAPGSHASGTWYMPRSFIKGTPMVFDEGTLAEIPAIDEDSVVGWALEPGDAVAFHMLTLHRAGGSSTRRRAFSVRALGDDVTFAPRPHRTSPPFPGLEKDLAPGAPMDHRLFPVLWPR
jgi:ectoine hydroxylase-related dioxygenase (phytanoyl-CoA dioxygenase family)